MNKYTQEMLDDFFYMIEKNPTLLDDRYRHYAFAHMDLSGLDFRDHDLRKFSLDHSILKGADLSNALIDINTSFEDAIFDKNTKMPFVQSVCPEEGAFIGYKKALIYNGTNLRTTNIKHYSYCIVKLLIPEDAKRSSGLGSKCRCNKAKVLDIESLNNDSEAVSLFSLIGVYKAVSLYDRSFVYRIGETVKVEDFDECRWHICAPGIHFYMEPLLAILH